MKEQIHGHEVMKMMIEAKRHFTKPELKEAIIKEFGSDARFFTCSAENMNAEEIIDLLQEKGKFTQSSSGLTTSQDKICHH
jgi:probable metal-binding protein